jgi:hypothetical protein
VKGTRPSGDRLLRERTAQPHGGATLAKAGFKDIYHLTGGIAAWRGAGLPVEK